MCRNGRRGGLKIPCANNTCGFDPHHRHKKGNPPARLEGFLFYLRRVSGSNSTALQGERYAVCGFCLCVKKGNCRTVFLCRSFCFLSAARSACAGSSVPPYSAPAAGRFCPPYLLLLRRPVLPGPAACFAGRSYYTRQNSAETLFRSFILLFLTDFTMFFIKKSLQMNFKNILYNYRSRFFTQTISYRFVWGRQVMLSAPLLPCDRSLEPAGAAPLHQIKYRRKVMHHA